MENRRLTVFNTGDDGLTEAMPYEELSQQVCALRVRVSEDVVVEIAQAHPVLGALHFFLSADEARRLVGFIK